MVDISEGEDAVEEESESCWFGKGGGAGRIMFRAFGNGLSLANIKKVR